MSNFSQQNLERMPEHLTKFLDTLTGNELNELQKINGRLIAKIYQAGAMFMLEAGSDIARNSNDAL